MSGEERHAIIGRTVEEYNAVKIEVAALVTKAERLGDALSQVGFYLKQLPQSRIPLQDFEEHLAALCSVDDLRKLLSEIDTARAKRASLSSRLGELGVTLRD